MVHQSRKEGIQEQGHVNKDTVIRSRCLILLFGTIFAPTVVRAFASKNNISSGGSCSQHVCVLIIGFALHLFQPSKFQTQRLIEEMPYQSPLFTGSGQTRRFLLDFLCEVCNDKASARSLAWLSAMENRGQLF